MAATVPCRFPQCAAAVLFARDPKGKDVAFDAKPFLQPDVPRENAWRLIDGLKGKKLATKDGVPEAISVYVKHHVTCPGTEVRGIESAALRRRRDENRRSAMHTNA